VLAEQHSSNPKSTENKNANKSKTTNGKKQERTTHKSRRDKLSGV